ncbi:MAG: hypothetical protein IPG99_10770 [Ignavibacteria bacterium]|nr:hypothetical protein [Ignavibacteria bacterium]
MEGSCTSDASSSHIFQGIIRKLQYHTDAVVKRGSDFDFYGISLQYFWI